MGQRQEIVTADVIYMIRAELSDTTLRCTYCGGPLRVNLEWRGPAYLQEQYAEAIECDDYKCGAEWDPDGSVRMHGRPQDAS